MRRHPSSKKYQGEKYLRDRNLLVSSATLRLTEDIKRKARRTQIREESKRELRLRLRRTLLSRDRSTQTHDDQFILWNDNFSDTSTEEISFVPDNNASLRSIVTRTVKFCLTLLFTFIAAIAICVFIGHYLRVYPSYSRL